jgi:hypothetical protein
MFSFTPLPLYHGGKNPSYHWTGEWMDPKAVWMLWSSEKYLVLPGIEARPFGP